MSLPLLPLAVILLATFVLMLSNRVRPDIVALLAALALGLTGVIGLDQVFAGFSSSAVSTIIAIYVVAQGLQRTGVTRNIGAVIARLGGHSERALSLAVMLSGAGLSLLMNNVAAAAIVLPAAVYAVKQRDVAPSKVMMPLAFATAFGGMATYLTTGNIVASDVLVARGFRGFGLLDFAPVGLPLVVAGIVFMLTLGRRLLPQRLAFDVVDQHDRLQTTYELVERLNQVRIPAGSPFVGKRIADSDIGRQFGLSVMALRRGAETIFAPAPRFVLNADDTLALVGRAERAEQLVAQGGVVPDSGPNIALSRGARNADAALVELTLAPRSRAAGQSLRALRFREKYGANAIAIWHGGRSVRTDVASVLLSPGDALLIQASQRAISLIESDGDFLALQKPSLEAPVRADRAIFAVVVLVIGLIINALNVLPTAHAMMLAALAMVLGGCLSMDEAYRSIEWRAVFLVAGLLPVSQALNTTGAAVLVANGFVAVLAPFGNAAVAAGLLILAAMLAQLMSGQVAGAVLAPIAISAATALSSDPRAMVMYVALGASLTFITPTAHPVNVFVMGAGGYAASDYPRVGIPLTLVLIAVVLLLAPLVWRV